MAIPASFIRPRHYLPKAVAEAVGVARSAATVRRLLSRPVAAPVLSWRSKQLTYSFQSAGKRLASPIRKN